MSRDDARKRKRAQPPLPSVDTRRKGEHVVYAGDEPARINDDPGGPAYTTSVRERAPEPTSPGQLVIRALLASPSPHSTAPPERNTVAGEIARAAREAERQAKLRAVTPAEEVQELYREHAARIVGAPTPVLSEGPPTAAARRRSAEASVPARRRNRSSKASAALARRNERAKERRAAKRAEHIGIVRAQGADGYDPIDFSRRAYQIAAKLQAETWVTHDDGTRELLSATAAENELAKLPVEARAFAEVACLTKDGDPGPLVRDWTDPVARKTLVICLVLFHMGKSSSRRGVRRCAGGCTETMLTKLLRAPGKKSLSLSRVKGLGKKRPGTTEYQHCGYMQRVKRSGFTQARQMRGRRLLARFPQFFGPPKRIKLRDGRTVLRRFGFNRYDFPTTHFRAKLGPEARELVRRFHAPATSSSFHAAQAPPASRAGP